MPQWIVTATSMPITADTAEQAIARASDSNGGTQWNAYPLHPDRPGAFDLEVETTTGGAPEDAPPAADVLLPVLSATLGPTTLAAYQYRDEDDLPGPVVVIDIDHADPDTELRVYVNDGPLRIDLD